MRRVLIPFLTGLLALGVAGVVNAATLNWEGTFVLDLSEFGRSEMRGGGVATVNGSAGGVPAHLSTLRLAASRLTSVMESESMMEMLSEAVLST